MHRPAACSWFRGPRSNGTRFFRLLEAAQRSLMDERSGLWGRLFNYCSLSNLKQSTWKLQPHSYAETASITVDLPLPNHLLSSKMSV